MGSTDTTSWSIRSALRQAGELNRVDLALRLTLLELLLRPIGNWAIRPFILSLAIVGLLFPRHIRWPVLWGALTCLTGLRVVHDWPLPDNHAYLLCYWRLAVFLSLMSHDTDDGSNEEMKGHGTREMPLWGDRFHAERGSAEMWIHGSQGRILSLVHYLESIQEE